MFLLFTLIELSKFLFFFLVAKRKVRIPITTWTPPLPSPSTRRCQRTIYVVSVLYVFVFFFFYFILFIYIYTYIYIYIYFFFFNYKRCRKRFSHAKPRELKLTWLSGKTKRTSNPPRRKYHLHLVKRRGDKIRLVMWCKTQKAINSYQHLTGAQSENLVRLNFIKSKKVERLNSHVVRLDFTKSKKVERLNSHVVRLDFKVKESWKTLISQSQKKLKDLTPTWMWWLGLVETVPNCCENYLKDEEC